MNDKTIYKTNNKHLNWIDDNKTEPNRNSNKLNYKCKLDIFYIQLLVCTMLNKTNSLFTIYIIIFYLTKFKTKCLNLLV